MNFNFDPKALENFFRKLAHPSASQDLNAFLEKMPTNAGQTILIMAGVAWAAAGALGLFTTVKIQELTELRAKLQEAESLQPVVPRIVDKPINPNNVKAFAEKMSSAYANLDIKAQGSSIVITASQLNLFGQFRESIGHLQNGGSGWRVNIDKLCVGRECQSKPLAGSFKINKVDITRPNS